MVVLLSVPVVQRVASVWLSNRWVRTDFPEMSKRIGRLQTPEAFKRALMTKPLSRFGGFLVYTIPSDDIDRLGFVLPKKLVRRAVQRNQIKRWSREIIRTMKTNESPTTAFVVRVNTAFSMPDWHEKGKRQAKEALHQMFQKGFTTLNERRVT